jgi:hypothetical protein
MKYINYLYDNESDLWNNLVNISSEETIINYLMGFIPDIKQFSFNKQIIIYTKIFSSDKAKLLLKNKDIWFTNTGRSLEETFMGTLILSAWSKDTTIWSNNIKKLQQFILSFFSNKSTRLLKDIWIEWFSTILNVNIIMKNLNRNIEDIDQLKNVSSIEFLINVLSIIYLFFEDGLRGKVKRLDIIDCNYIQDNRCHIKWYDKLESNDNKYNLLTMFFFLLLDAIRIIYIPIYNHILYLEDYIKKIDLKIKYLSMMGTLNTQSTILICYKEKKELTDEINIMKSVTDNVILKNWLFDFYFKLILWIKSCRPSEFSIDDILDDLSYFIINNKDYQGTTGLRISKELLPLSLNIIGNKYMTGNPDIRYRFLQVIECIISEERSVLISELFVSVIRLHNDLKNYNSSNMSKINKRYHIYELIINNILNPSSNQDSKRFINSYFKENPNLGMEFVNIMLNDINFFNNDILDELEAKIESQPRIFNEYVAMLMGALSQYCQTIKILFHFLDVEQFIMLLTKNELLMTLCVIINRTVNRLIKSYNCKFKYKENADMNTLINNVLYYISDICIGVDKYSNKFIETLAIESLTFDIELFKKLKVIFKDKEKYWYNDLNNFIDSCIGTIEEHEEVDELEYPDEFVDPITYSPIKDPILLPNMKGFENMYFERSTIIKHILNSSQNPYTREPLTIKEVDEYNNKTNIRDKLDNFKIRFDKWISSQNK